MSKGMMTPALSCIERARQAMRADGTGEPAVQIPMSDISVCLSMDGARLAFISMKTLVELIEQVEMRYPEPR